MKLVQKQGAYFLATESVIMALKASVSSRYSVLGLEGFDVVGLQ